ncbi:branched-chain amino acid ABC transporter, periplasmic amino acid-binding protein [Caballeronia fortuita]|uniref:Branched-chain amino acid ABC transporter, periplasmic amino acid-binding protein n=1 Tax=Caballeronia fortuita TaxID=1777138 RepID=A0A158CC54_9BURK|nr:substrate-binding domain-containing protein [Caballeronia fortuita]SAK79496.1 branched-chain amino acid ABC transporter, periplasmic amino acid-binding protein [Caballeronia fortuita]
MDRRSFMKAGAVTAVGFAGPSFSVAAQAEGKPLKVALMANMSGPAAFFGEACKNCATLAVSDLNARGGILGRPLELLVGDSGTAPAEASQTALRLWRRDGAEVFIGSHDSAVRTALEGVFRGKVPYFYTPTYEGSDCSPGTFFLGETPKQQIAPVMPYLAQQFNIKRWYFVGNDYIWPRKSNDIAKKLAQSTGGSIVGEEYVPFTVDNFDSTLVKIRDSKADAVFITLVGGSSVTFNRAFASFGLSDKVLRYGTLLEENTVAGIGAQATANLYAASGFFSSAKTPAIQAFMSRYHSKFGNTSVLSTVGESVFEGFMMLDAVAGKARALDVASLTAASEGATFNGPRGKVTMKRRNAISDIYLAKANGTSYDIVKTFPQADPGEACPIDHA